MASRVLPCAAQPTLATEVQYPTLRCCNHVLVISSSGVPGRAKKLSIRIAFLIFIAKITTVFLLNLTSLQAF